MLITRETDYALRILRGLADGEQHTAGDLAQSEQIPQQFAYKILKKLHKAGLVEVTRGTAGGCRLAAQLDAVTLYDLMEAMDEDRAVNACMNGEYVCQWREAHGNAACRVHAGLRTVQAALDRELKAHSLREIILGG